MAVRICPKCGSASVRALEQGGPMWKCGRCNYTAKGRSFLGNGPDPRWGKDDFQDIGKGARRRDAHIDEDEQ